MTNDNQYVIHVIKTNNNKKIAFTRQIIPFPKILERFQFHQ